VSVDRFTGYRYYSADQLPRLNRILALKDLGLSLEQIAPLLRDKLTVEQMRGMLRLKQVEAHARVREEQDRLARVEARLRQIEEEGKMPTYEVVIKKVPAHIRKLKDLTGLVLIGYTETIPRRMTPYGTGSGTLSSFCPGLVG